MIEFALSSGLPPFSFRYGGVASRKLLAAWPMTRVTDEAAGVVTTRFTSVDPVTSLRLIVTVRRFTALAAADWLLELENTGDADTPIIEQILPLDVSMAVARTERVLLHHANGSSCRMDDWLPQVTELRPGDRQPLATRGGRSSDGVCPFMNVQGSGGGLVLGIGWSGQWASVFRRSERTLRITAGMERTHLRLHPGERIRSPRLLAIPWRGDDMETGNNLLRQALIAHYLPRIDGELVTPPVAQCLQAYYYLTGNAGEQYEMQALPRVAALGADAYWIDACWYGSGQWWGEEAGSWTVNRERFPRGLKPISDAAHAAGLKFLLWFEPERAHKGTQIDREHPEYLLHDPRHPENKLINLGMPEARRYLTDVLSAAIAEHGIDIFRQDCNIEPLRYWQRRDDPDRAGMTEIRYVEGLYAMWDELRRRHPHLWIDNCASGGRRVDLETLSRSLPLWPTDFCDTVGLPHGMGLHVGDQCTNAGLAHWMPFFGGGVWNFTPYSTRGQVMGGFSFGFHIPHQDFAPDPPATVVPASAVMAKGKKVYDDGFPFDDARAAIAESHYVQQFLTGDFHLLRPLTVSYHDWCAWQLHRPDLHAGVAVFLRRHRSTFSAMEAGLKQIEQGAQYEVSLSRGYTEGQRRRMSGADLARLTVTIDDMPGSILLRYTRVPA